MALAPVSWTRSRTSNSVAPEELAVGLGGEQLGDPPVVVLGGLMQGLVDPLGFGRCSGVRSVGGCAWRAVREDRGWNFAASHQTTPVVRDFPPTFETPTPAGLLESTVIDKVDLISSHSTKTLTPLRGGQSPELRA